MRWIDTSLTGSAARVVPPCIVNLLERIVLQGEHYIIKGCAKIEAESMTDIMSF